MEILVIYGHPGRNNGYASNLLRQALKILDDKKIGYEVLDLYEMGYDPVLKEDELYTAGNKNVSKENQEIQQKIRQAKGLIFIYPVWWGTMPAILKGFMDRVFTPGFAFKYRADKFFKFIPDRLLNDKRIVVLTSCGGPEFVYKFLFDPIKLVNKFIVFGIFASKSKTFQIYGAGRMTEEKEKQIIKITQKGVDWLIKYGK